MGYSSERLARRPGRMGWVLMAPLSPLLAGVPTLTVSRQRLRSVAMAAPTPRHLALAAMALAAVAGLGLVVAGPLNPSEPATRPTESGAPATTPAPTASSVTPSPSPSTPATVALPA